MRKRSTIRKGTAGLLLAVFFMSLLMDGLAFKVIQSLSDHDHEIQAVPGAQGIHLRLVHDDHHDHSDIELSEGQAGSRFSTADRTLGFHEEVGAHADHDLSLMTLDDSIPSVTKSSSTALQPLITLSTFSYPPALSARHRAISTCSSREPSTLVQVRSIVLLV